MVRRRIFSDFNACPDPSPSSCSDSNESLTSLTSLTCLFEQERRRERSESDVTSSIDFDSGSYQSQSSEGKWGGRNSRQKSLKSCLRKRTESEGRKKPWFSAHKDVQIMSMGGSGWWSSEEIERFRGRLLRDIKWESNVKRRHSVSATYFYDYYPTPESEMLDADLEDYNDEEGDCSSSSVIGHMRLEPTTEACISSPKMSITCELTCLVKKVLVVEEDPNLSAMLVDHVMRLYPNVTKADVYVLHDLSSFARYNDTPFDMVLIDRARGVSGDAVAKFFRRKLPKCLIIGLDRPAFLSPTKVQHTPVPLAAVKLYHMLWPLPPPRTDKELRVRLDNAFSIIRQHGAAMS